MNESWKSKFTERELKEIEFCRIYARDFAHGTDGHNIRMIVWKMAKLLDDNELVVPDMDTHYSSSSDIVYAIGSENIIAKTSLNTEMERCNKCGQIYYKAQSHSCPEA